MNIQELFINEDLSIKEAIKKLDETAKKILLVVEDNKLIGVLTDGDIRRWILKSGSLSDPVSLIMIKTPISISEEDRKDAKKILKEYSIEAIPVLK
ncbi:CBS domain-containing protein [Tissierella carlieri]|uniref:CBS domain-containing protein n=1 Tax=Tissierella carlieri TaxID=689904 RepID=UPI00386DFE6E